MSCSRTAEVACPDCAAASKADARKRSWSRPRAPTMDRARGEDVAWRYRRRVLEDASRRRECRRCHRPRSIRLTSCRSAWASGHRRWCCRRSSCELFTHLAAGPDWRGDRQSASAFTSARSMISSTPSWRWSSSSATVTAARRRYRNTAETALFLDKNSPAYIGGILEMANARLYRFWGDLTDGTADRQAAERDQAHRRSRCSTSSTATQRGSSSSWRRWRHLGRQLPSVGRKVRFLRSTRRSAMSAAPLASCRRSSPPPSAHALHQLLTCRSSRRSPSKAIAAAGLERARRGRVRSISSPIRYPRPT